MAADDDALVAVEALRKSYGSTVAVDGIDLAVHSGEVFGLLGPNGAGKTTTVLMLLGLSEPDGGTVEVCGMDPARDPLAVKRLVGYLPDTVGFYDDLTAWANLRYTAELNEVDRREADRRIAELLDRVGLADVADHPVKSYSRGMRQRLGLADALVKDPLVVILDEPTVGIDPEGVREMQALITELGSAEGRAVLLTSHMLPQVQQTCDRMAIFVDGRIIAEGTAADLASNLAEGRRAFEVVARDGGDGIDRVMAETFGDDGEVTVAGSHRWRVGVPAESAERLLPALVEAGVAVTELRELGSDLDEIYHRYFTAYEEVGS